MQENYSDTSLFPLAQEKNNVLIYLTILPGAKKNAFIKVTNKSIALSLKAEASHGQANQALIEFFSSLFGKPTSQFLIKKGHTSQKKILLVKNSSLLEIENLLQPLLPGA